MSSTRKVVITFSVNSFLTSVIGIVLQVSSSSQISFLQFVNASHSTYSVSCVSEEFSH